MSGVTPAPNAEEDEGVLIDPADGVSAFQSLMAVLAPSENEEGAPAGGDAAAAAAAGDGQSAAPGEGAAGAAAAAGAPGAGDGGSGGVAPGAPAAGTPEADAALGIGDIDASAYDAHWGEVLSGLERRSLEELTAEAVDYVRTEYKGYVDLLDEPARVLVGTQVPSLKDPQKMETLRDVADVESYQDAVRKTLGKVVQEQISRNQDDTRGTMEMLTRSAELFQNNPDLIPGTKTFDKELADQFVAMAKDFEVELDGKVIGYSVPVQSFITNIRTRLVAQRAAAAAAQPSAQQQQAANQPRTPAGQFTTPPANQPQAAIPNKAAGGGAQGEDLSTLFGTLGNPDFTI